MLLVENNSLNPYFNIAAEEYLLKEYEADVAMIWRSNASIIVGKHQNTLAEINLDYVIQNRIPVVRRLSGGGTVFHDPGNVNFTFIFRHEKEKLVDFVAYTRPVVLFLQLLGVHAKFEGKNNLKVNGIKISGNAEHVYKNKVLHHGTLLFNANLEHLEEAIKAKEENFVSKAVKSNRMRVQNISHLIDPSITCEEFLARFRLFLTDYFKGIESFSFSAADIERINQLSNDKYQTWGWNYGYSPTFILTNTGCINGTPVSVRLHVARGKIVSIDQFLISNTDYSTFLNSLLTSKEHDPVAIEYILMKNKFLQIDSASNPWEIVRLFF